MERSEPTGLELLWLALGKMKEEKPEGLSDKGRLYAIAITQLQLLIGFVQTFIFLGESSPPKIKLFVQNENDTPT